MCGTESPAKSFTCRVAITTAMPAVKPVVTGCGTNWMSPPMRTAPSTSRRMPAMRVATISPPMPNSAEIGARSTTKAAVGPETWKREPPRTAMAPPATMAV